MKVLSIIVKYLPIFIALMYFINSVLSLCDIYISAITFTVSCGFAPLLLIYVCCSVLKYCVQYKAYLGYIAINNIINWLDYEYGFTENIDFTSFSQICEKPLDERPAFDLISR